MRIGFEGFDLPENAIEFVTFVGIPASGKSTLAKEYEKRGYKILSSDVVRADIEQKLASGEIVMPSNTDLNSMVFDQIRKEAISSLQENVSVVFDATNLGRRRRMNFRKSLYRMNCLHTCMLFITSKDECLRRNSLREGYARLPDEAMYKMFCNFECPNYWEGWDRIIPVIDDLPYSFDLSKTVGFSQTNPHQQLSLDEHMQAAYAFAVEQGFSEAVQKVARVHDIGKFYTKRFEDRRGEPTKTPRFYGHENYGAYLYLTEACCGKTLTKEEFDRILYETNLINCHMRPFSVWRDNPKAREKDKRIFGEQFYADLKALNACDRAAR